jgi:hypothetical protein
MDTEKKPAAPTVSLIDLDDTPNDDENPDHEKAFNAEQLQVFFLLFIISSHYITPFTL